MEEVIKYFEGLEERIATLEAELASLKSELEELKNRPLPEPQVVEKIVEKIIEKPVEVKAQEVPEVQEVQEVPEVQEVSKVQEVQEEAVDHKAAIYGKAVDDIRQAISLGDRFLYQRELFGQNAELMQKTLTELNELGSFDEAVAYISSHFHWDTESSTYQQFLVTLHRRFG